MSFLVFGAFFWFPEKIPTKVKAETSRVHLLGLLAVFDCSTSLCCAIERKLIRLFKNSKKCEK